MLVSKILLSPDSILFYIVQPGENKAFQDEINGGMFTIRYTSNFLIMGGKGEEAQDK